MNRTTLARRYAPLAALAAVQLLIIATVPSKAPAPAAEVSAGSGDSVTSDGSPIDENAVIPENTFVDEATGQIIDRSTGQVVGTTSGGGTGGTRTGTAGGTAGGGTAGGGTT